MTENNLCLLSFQTTPSDPIEAQKFELKKMRTLERRAKTSELQRLRKAQVIIFNPEIRDTKCAVRVS